MSDETRQQGVELGGLQTALESASYPIAHEAVLEKYGDAPVETETETVTLETLIGPLNEDEYDSYDELEQAVMSMVGEDAIGRKNYSDRTPPAPGEARQKSNPSGEDLESDHESF